MSLAADLSMSSCIISSTIRLYIAISKEPSKIAPMKAESHGPKYFSSKLEIAFPQFCGTGLAITTVKKLAACSEQRDRMCHGSRTSAPKNSLPVFHNMNQVANGNEPEGESQCKAC